MFIFFSMALALGIILSIIGLILLALLVWGLIAFMLWLGECIVKIWEAIRG